MKLISKFSEGFLLFLWGCLILMAFFLINFAHSIFSSPDAFPKFMAVVGVGLAIMFFAANRIFAELPTLKDKESSSRLIRIEDDLISIKESIISMNQHLENIVKLNEDKEQLIKTTEKDEFGHDENIGSLIHV